MTSAPVPGGPVPVTVAVPTYRRPDDLRALLPMLREHAGELNDRGAFAVDVLVIDNDPQGGAAEVVSAAGGVRYVAEPRPGIAAVRDRALDEAADARLLVFIDDDERPREGWLAHLLGTWQATGATAVAGRVVPEYGAEPDPWILAGGFFVRRSMPTGTEVDLVATGNLLLDLAQVRAAGLRFDAAVGLGGGEDSLFSRALARAGGRIVWCDESAVVDQVPPQRMTRAWVLTRMWSQGNGVLLTDLRLATAPGDRLLVRLRGIGNGSARVLGGAARWGWGVLRGSLRDQARGARTLVRGAGMVGGAVGVVYQEYARSGRRWTVTWFGAR